MPEGNRQRQACASPLTRRPVEFQNYNL